MPALLERRQQTADLHPITFRCQDRNPYLRPSRAASIFEHALEAMRLKYGFQVYGLLPVVPSYLRVIGSVRALAGTRVRPA